MGLWSEKVQFLFVINAIFVTANIMNKQIHTLRSFLPDPFVQLLIATILLATLLPVYGQGAKIASVISQIGIFLLFFLNGIRLPRQEVLSGIRNWQLQASIYFWVFAIMPFIGWGLSQLSIAYIPEALAVGILFLGVLPSTVQSATAYNSLAKGNVTASVIASAILNLTGVVVTPLLFAVLASSSGVHISYESFLRICLILLLPFFLGQYMQKYWAGWLGKRKNLVAYMDRGAIAVAVYVAFSGAVVAGIWSHITLNEFIILFAILIIFLVLAFTGSWVMSGLFKFVRNDRKAVMFAGAHKSLAIGAPLAAILFPPETAGVILLPILIYHLAQLIISAPLANRLAKS